MKKLLTLIILSLGIAGQGWAKEYSTRNIEDGDRYRVTQSGYRVAQGEYQMAHYSGDWSGKYDRHKRYESKHHKHRHGHHHHGHKKWRYRYGYPHWRHRPHHGDRHHYRGKHRYNRYDHHYRSRYYRSDGEWQFGVIWTYP
ncbi:hypothetical protein [Hahella ganghwensis]|uniref:hypothetical protein n=1 Tax=Hahella ganghwensis TaxID=286420 RepID=UPI0012FC2398|nr:hypothetical protein [Hahella ganghwensis]